MDRLFLPNRIGSDAIFVDQGSTGAGSDTVAPFIAGELTAPVVGTHSYTLAWPAATDNMAVASYEVSLDGGATYGNVGNVLNATFGGRQPNTPYQNRLRAIDSSGNASNVLALTVKTLALVTPPDDVETAARFARPYADVTAGTWLPSQPGAGLFSMIDEPNPNAADFIYATGAGYCEIRLQPVKDPQTSAGQKIRYQLWDEGGGAMTVHLMQGSAYIATWEHLVLPPVPTEQSQTLTPIECDSITNYADLRLRFVAA